jgi:predicted Zn-dependent protease
MRRFIAARRVVFAVVCTGLIAACATTTSSTGRRQYVGAVPQERLDALGADAFAQVKASKKIAGDARQQRNVRCVADAIIAQLPQSAQRNWEIVLFADENPNAFALPGGKLGVYTGIFTVARNQDQLAAVIGHEIGHVLERHHDERITRQAGAAGVLQLLGVLTGARYGEGAAQSIGRGGGLLVQAGFLLPGTRQQESEADVVGQRLMAQAGFDPREAEKLWQNMSTAAGGSRPPEWLSTHPDPRARMGELRARAERLMPEFEAARSAGRRPVCG